MKKIITLLLVVTFILVGCTKTKENVKEGIQQKYITLDELDKKIEAKDTFVFSVVSKTCSHCIEFKKYLERYKQNDTVYFLEASELTKDDLNRLFKKYPGITGTPTTFFYTEGKQNDTIFGYDEKTMEEKLNSFYKK